MGRHLYQGTFKDANGAVVGTSTTSDGNAGTISVFLAGGSTAADVYTASSGGSAVNSVSTDAYGYFEFYVDDSEYTPTQLFKITLSHPDVRSKTYDEIKVIPDEPYYYYCDATATNQGAATSEGNRSLKDLIDDIGTSKKATIKLPHSGTGNVTTYVLGTNETVPSNIYLEPENGAELQPAAGVTLTMYAASNLKCGDQQKFIDTTNNSTNPIVFTNGGTVRVDWFGENTTPGTTDMYNAMACANASIEAGMVLWGSQTYGLGTGLTWKDHITYQGMGTGATIIKALAAIDMVTVANNQYSYNINDMRFDGDSQATTAWKLGDSSVQSGFCNFSNIEIHHCAIGIDANWFFNTDFDRVQIRNCTDTALKITQGQGNKGHMWIHDNAKDFVFDNLADSWFHIIAYTNTAGFVRCGEMTNNCKNVNITGQFETSIVPSGGELFLIDDDSQGVKLRDCEFYCTITPVTDIDFDLVRIGDTGDSGPTIATVIQGCKFFDVDDAGGFYHIRIDYGASTVIKDCHSSETGEAILIYEDDTNQGTCAQTQYKPITGEDNVVAISANTNLTAQHMNRIIEVTTGAGTITVDVPQAEHVKGNWITVVKVDSGAGSVTLSRQAGTENFQPGDTSTITIASQYDYVTVYSMDDEDDWLITDRRDT